MRKFVIPLAALALSGCAEQLISDQTIRDKTAFVLNEPANTITISDRRYDGVAETRYIAHTYRGTYSCILDGGSTLR